MEARNGFGYLTHEERAALKLDPHGSENEGYPLLFLAARIAKEMEARSQTDQLQLQLAEEARLMGESLPTELEDALVYREHLMDMAYIIEAEKLATEIENKL